MRRTWFLTSLLAISLAATGCASNVDGPVPEDGGAGDAPTIDARSSVDAGTDGRAGIDASKEDAGMLSDDAGSDTSVAPPPDAGESGVVGSTCGGGPTTLDGSLVTFEWNPPDLASWPVTTTLTEVDFIPQGLNLQFSKRDGANRWPDVTPPGWGGPLQYTVGLVECINGQWYGSAVIEIWYGLQTEGGNNLADCSPSFGPAPCPGHMQVQENWYYDTIPVGPLKGRQPATGEIIGVFVAAGNLRGITTDDPAQSPVMERSDIVLVPFPDVSGATHSF